MLSLTFDILAVQIVLGLEKGRLIQVGEKHGHSNLIDFGFKKKN